MASRNQDGKFAQGNRLAPGGPRPNSGPKPSEVKELERSLVQNPESLIAAWRRLEQLALVEGNLDALKYMIDRAWGKPNVTMTATGSGSFNLVILPPEPAMPSTPSAPSRSSTSS